MQWGSYLITDPNEDCPIKNHPEIAASRFVR